MAYGELESEAELETIPITIRLLLFQWPDKVVIEVHNTKHAIDCLYAIIELITFEQ